MNKDEIRVLLKDGYSIQEICQHYQLPFQELVKLMRENIQINKACNRPQELLYITSVNNRWIIRKQNVHYGTYHSLEDAVKIRDWFLTNGFDKDCIDKACKECGVERSTNEKPKGMLYLTRNSTGRYVLRKKNVNYGTYHTLEDAVKVRDYFIFNGFDKRKVDEVCDFLGVVRCH